MNTRTLAEGERSTLVDFPVTILSQQQLNNLLSKTNNNHNSFSNSKFNSKSPSNSNEISIQFSKDKEGMKKEISEGIIDFLQHNEVLESTINRTSRPQLTYFEVHTVKPDVARNLALHGNPEGQSTKSKSMALLKSLLGIEENTAWPGVFNQSGMHGVP